MGVWIEDQKMIAEKFIIDYTHGIGLHLLISRVEQSLI